PAVAGHGEGGGQPPPRGVVINVHRVAGAASLSSASEDDLIADGDGRHVAAGDAQRGGGPLAGCDVVDVHGRTEGAAIECPAREEYLGAHRGDRDVVAGDGELSVPVVGAVNAHRAVVGHEQG